MMYPGNSQVALRAIEHGVWVSIVLSAIVSGTLTWSILTLRSRLIQKVGRRFLINALTTIAVVLSQFGVCYLASVAIEPASLLQSDVGLWCLPPTQFQMSLLPVASLIAAILHGISQRYRA